MTIDAYPLCWPPGRPRKAYPASSAFGKNLSFARCRDTLMREIRALGGARPILSTNIPLKLDGMPYGTFSPPKDKGVAVYFTLKTKPMVFACDEWDRIEHNVWAIARTIEALRGIKRWGSGDMLERAFTGFASLPVPETKRHWREVLGFLGSGHVPVHLLTERRNVLAQTHHPDKGGDPARMVEINRAYAEAAKEMR